MQYNMKKLWINMVFVEWIAIYENKAKKIKRRDDYSNKLMDEQRITRNSNIF